MLYVFKELNFGKSLKDFLYRFLPCIVPFVILFLLNPKYASTDYLVTKFHLDHNHNHDVSYIDIMLHGNGNDHEHDEHHEGEDHQSWIKSCNKLYEENKATKIKGIDLDLNYGPFLPLHSSVKHAQIMNCGICLFKLNK